MIRLFIIEDQTAPIVAAFKTFFRPGRDQISVTGCAANVERALTEADPGSFDLIVLDLWIPGFEPLENIKNLRARFTGKPVIIYTGEKRQSWKHRMMKAGAMAYVTKDVERDEIRTALIKATKGETYVTGLMAEDNTDSGSGLPDHEMQQLNPVQLEILEMLKKGFNHKEIAKKMKTSTVSIERYLYNLRNTYKVKNNIQLISFLMEKGKL